MVRPPGWAWARGLNSFRQSALLQLLISHPSDPSHSYEERSPGAGVYSKERLRQENQAQGWSLDSETRGRGGQGQHRLLHGLQSHASLEMTTGWVTYSKIHLTSLCFNVFIRTLAGIIESASEFLCDSDEPRYPKPLQGLGPEKAHWGYT